MNFKGLILAAGAVGVTGLIIGKALDKSAKRSDKQMRETLEELQRTQQKAREIIDRADRMRRRDDES